MFANKFFFLLLLSVSIPACVAAQIESANIHFMQDVLFHTEYQVTPDRYCKQWATAPKLSVFGSQSRHPRVVENVVKQLNSCLPSDKQIQILRPESGDATLKLYFVKHSEMRGLAEQNEFQFETENWGYFYNWWNNKYEIERAMVMIAENKISGNRLHHFVLEEVTQSLGFPGDSHRFPDSVFYEDRDKREYGKATKLSKQDSALIRFHYRYNKIGDIPIQVGLNLAKYLQESGSSPRNSDQRPGRPRR